MKQAISLFMIYPSTLGFTYKTSGQVTTKETDKADLLWIMKLAKFKLLMKNVVRVQPA